MVKRYSNDESRPCSVVQSEMDNFRIKTNEMTINNAYIADKHGPAGSKTKLVFRICVATNNPNGVWSLGRLVVGRLVFAHKIQAGGGTEL